MGERDYMYDTLIRQANTRTYLGSIVFRDGAPESVWSARKRRVFEAEIQARIDAKEF
jgi:hypothetical protein